MKTKIGIIIAIVVLIFNVNCKKEYVTNNYNDTIVIRDTIKIKQPIDITNGLVGYWPFNGNADDESKMGNNGIVYGAMLTTDRFGNANSAYSFNGFSYIEIPNSSGLSFKTNPFTISLWFKTSAINTGDILSKDRKCVTPSEFRISFEGYNLFTELTDINYHNPGDQGEASLTLNSVNYYVNLPVWTNIIYIRNLKTIKIFVNGALLKQKECDIIINQNNDLNFRIGARYNIDGIWTGCRPGTSDFFNGMIDDIRIYNRALTTSEVLQLYSH